MGEHRWKDFLRAPDATEVDEVSYIFPCTLSTSRAIAKAGWICHDIPLTQFKKWSPEKDNFFTTPYPHPRYCEPPSEDVTRYPLCRPIPQSSQAPPSKTNEDVATTSTSETSDVPATPPGLPAPAHHFAAAIHGCDIPHASDVVTDYAGGLPAAQPYVDADDENNEDDTMEKNLCGTHGALCVSGICKECAARKREERLAERARQIELERGRRGHGRGRGQGHGGGRGRERGADWRSQRSGYPNDIPRHLKDNIPGGHQHQTDARSRLREDIRTEMASRKEGGKSVASSTGRAMPSHLRKGAERIPKTSSSSAASISTLSEGSRSLSGSSPAPSVSGASEDDARSVTSSSGCSAAVGTDFKGGHPAPSPRSQFGPWGNSVNWRPYAKIERDADTESVATGATSDAFRNPWKHVKPLQPGPLKWAVDVKKAGTPSSPVIRNNWDDDESDDEVEPF
ncbi:hypothetical protein C8Q79DRAFT_745657 [Trametes meyenii]|nr:hypothetical protein C8Q79DRAFT_745657 [Trametes meyenii]